VGPGSVMVAKVSRHPQKENGRKRTAPEIGERKKQGPRQLGGKRESLYKRDSEKRLTASENLRFRQGGSAAGRSRKQLAPLNRKGGMKELPRCGHQGSREVVDNPGLA